MKWLQKGFRVSHAVSHRAAVGPPAVDHLWRGVVVAVHVKLRVGAAPAAFSLLVLVGARVGGANQEVVCRDQRANGQAGSGRTGQG